MSCCLSFNAVARRSGPFIRRVNLASLFPLLIVLLAACGRSESPPLPNDAYVWQRQWTPAVIAALADSTGLVEQWRVLAAEMSAGGRWMVAAPDLAALAATRRHVVLVLRLDGRADALPRAAVQERIATTVSAWRLAGIPVTGVEIDYDCPTSKLPAYSAFLAELRSGLEPELRLSITALPTWLESPHLLTLLRNVDESVLQVHAVLSPSLGLFDARRAAAWLEAYAQQTQRPWRVALPNYGSRVVWDDVGRVVAIESERPALQAEGQASELVATPPVIANFIEQLNHKRPSGLAGIVWFRLPTDADVRIWSLPTWHAVMARQALHSRLELSAPVNRSTGAQDLYLANTGTADASLPFRVRVDGDCRVGDGINGYTLERDGAGMYLRRGRDGLLRAGTQRNIGWIRCNNAKTSFHVQP